ncbi:CRP-like cAMP-binding protein [Rhodoblastus acidophilus]|uniref:Crp/Fnr family transcriptional regulator n=1 Tax=Rhodoblastus acidophilus TaxID=1074 RepID=UPI0022253AD6|nr:Crp/Fnr family transcriptional regulator [Rhodoblastus acidophilus]MCW2283863.1 CRP-like cAMP-binding protein [Rhodoblastus acidophilus]MCW2332559.1 CRP-like cAMP-binding protein [Rhodoblastus acidophilus]
MGQKSIDIPAIVNGCRVFARLSEQERRELCGKARLEHYHERTLLTERDDRPEYLRYVVEGSLDYTLSTADGGYSYLPILPGKWMSWIGVFGTAPMMCDLWSSPNATLIALPARDLQRMVGANPAALLEVIDRVGEWTRLLTGWALSFAAFGPEKRLVYLLLLASSDGVALAREGHAAPVTQTHLSQFGFGSRQRVSRLLRGLSDKGLIQMRYGGVVIPSRVRLEAYLAGDSARGKVSPD